jgi:hypothetical protein
MVVCIPVDIRLWMVGLTVLGMILGLASVVPDRVWLRIAFGLVGMANMILGAVWVLS